VSYFATKAELSVVDQDFLRLDAGYLRRILLRILHEEEWGIFESHHRHIKYWEDKPGTSGGQESDRLDGIELVSDPHATAQVRITDLRLATNLKPQHLKAELEGVLHSLPLPVTTDGVTEWKWEQLKDPSELNEKQHKQMGDEVVERRDKVVAVSFAAAALLLLHDLGMGSIKNATDHGELARGVQKLAGIVKDLSAALDKSRDDLLGLLEGEKTRGRPRDPQAKDYAALCLHRMGYSRMAIAERVGITTFEDLGQSLPFEKWEQTARSKDWKKRLDDSIRRGLQVEREKFPKAAALIARRDDEDVRARAIEIYRDYWDQTNEALVTHHVDSIEVGEDLASGIPVSEDEELYRAYVQLGSCLVRGIEPNPAPLK
jgi:hypothetical protein